MVYGVYFIFGVFNNREIYENNHKNLANYKTNHTSFFLSKLAKQQNFGPNYPCQSNPGSPKSLTQPNLILIAGTVEQHWSSSSAANLTRITSNNTNSTNIMSNSNQDL